MRRIYVVAEAANGLGDCADTLQIVNAAGGATGNLIVGIQFNVGCNVIRVIEVIPDVLSLFNGDLLDCAFNLPQIIDAGGGLRFGAGMQETGNGNRCQEADDGHNDHDFHQREACHPRGFGSFHITSTFFLRREPHNRRVTMITVIVH